LNCTVSEQELGATGATYGIPETKPTATEKSPAISTGSVTFGTTGAGG
jgi:hypothetical protein